jgi:hypothetical protein
VLVTPTVVQFSLSQVPLCHATNTVYPPSNPTAIYLVYIPVLGSGVLIITSKTARQHESAEMDATQDLTKLTYQNFDYTRSHHTEAKDSFRCTKYRRFSPYCEGKLFRYPDGRINLRQHTTCLRSPVNVREPVVFDLADCDVPGTSSGTSSDDGCSSSPLQVFDVKEAMGEWADVLSIHHIAKEATEVWRLVMSIILIEM